MLKKNTLCGQSEYVSQLKEENVKSVEDELDKNTFCGHTEYGSQLKGENVGSVENGPIQPLYVCKKCPSCFTNEEELEVIRNCFGKNFQVIIIQFKIF